MHRAVLDSHHTCSYSHPPPLQPPPPQSKSHPSDSAAADSTHLHGPHPPDSRGHGGHHKGRELKFSDILTMPSHHHSLAAGGSIATSNTSSNISGLTSHASTLRPASSAESSASMSSANGIPPGASAVNGSSVDDSTDSAAAVTADHRLLPLPSTITSLSSKSSNSGDLRSILNADPSVGGGHYSVGRGGGFSAFNSASGEDVMVGDPQMSRQSADSVHSIGFLDLHTLPPSLVNPQLIETGAFTASGSWVPLNVVALSPYHSSSRGRGGAQVFQPSSPSRFMSVLPDQSTSASYIGGPSFYPPSYLQQESNPFEHQFRQAAGHHRSYPPPLPSRSPGHMVSAGELAGFPSHLSALSQYISPTSRVQNDHNLESFSSFAAQIPQTTDMVLPPAPPPRLPPLYKITARYDQQQPHPPQQPQPEYGGDEKIPLLERNRLAALKCRQKKKKRTEQLKHNLHLAQLETERLTAVVADLQEELFQLNALLSTARNCPVSLGEK